MIWSWFFCNFWSRQVLLSHKHGSFFVNTAKGWFILDWNQTEIHRNLFTLDDIQFNSHKLSFFHQFALCTLDTADSESERQKGEKWDEIETLGWVVQQKCLLCKELFQCCLSSCLNLWLWWQLGLSTKVSNVAIFAEFKSNKTSAKR